MRRFAHVCLLLVLFLGGVAGGAWISISRRAATFSAGIDRWLAASTNVAPDSGAEVKAAFRSHEETLSAIMSAVIEDDPLLRAHLLHDALVHLSSAEMAHLFERAVQVGDLDRRRVLLGALLARWAEVDAAGLADAVRPYQERFRALVLHDWRSLDLAVCQAWAAALPEAALAEAMQSPNRQWARITAQAAIESLAEGDPRKQLEVLADLPASKLRAQMCENAIKELAATDSAAAEAHLNLLPEPRQRTRVLSEILGKLAERDPAAGLARLTALARDAGRGTEGIQLVTAALRAAAKKDAKSALETVQNLPEELQTKALGPVLVGWAEKNPVEALTWAAENGVDLSEARSFSTFGERGGASWQTMLSIAFDSDRAKTLAWVRGQPASVERDEMLREGIWYGTMKEKLEIYAELTPGGQASGVTSLFQWQADTSELEPWVKSLPPGAPRQAAIRALGASQVRNSPERMDTIAEAWLAGPERDAVISGIVSSISSTDPQRALDFARRVGGTVARESAFETLARSWLYRDEAAARAWIVSAPELTAEQKRVLLRQADER